MMETIAKIYQPKYKTKEVLVHTRCVDYKRCYLFFVGDRNWKNLYSFDGARVMQECPMQKNGRGLVYVIPLDFLEDEGELPDELERERQRLYPDWKKKFTKKYY